MTTQDALYEALFDYEDEFGEWVLSASNSNISDIILSLKGAREEFVSIIYMYWRIAIRNRGFHEKTRANG